MPHNILESEEDVYKHWFKPRKYRPKILKIGEKFGFIKPGYTFEDYLREAVESGGYETVAIWGIQGSCKSNRMMMYAYWIYQNWNTVVDCFVFKPGEFVKRLQDLPPSTTIPCLNWDDIGVHYPASKFKTDIKEYEAIDSTWASIRTKCNVIITSNPVIDRLAKNIRDNVTIEVFIGRNQVEVVNRCFRLPGLGTLQSNFFKVQIEKDHKFNMYDVPTNEFRKYWKKRLRLADEALAKLARVSGTSTEGYKPVLTAAKDAKISPNTLQQMISRGILRGRKIQGRLHVLEEDFNKYIGLLKAGEGSKRGYHRRPKTE